MNMNLSASEPHFVFQISPPPKIGQNGSVFKIDTWISVFRRKRQLVMMIFFIICQAKVSHKSTVWFSATLLVYKLTQYPVLMYAYTVQCHAQSPNWYLHIAVCSGDICQYQHKLSCYWPNFYQTFGIQFFGCLNFLDQDFFVQNFFWPKYLMGQQIF